MSVKGMLRRNWKSRAMQPTLYTPDGIPFQEEFDRDAATIPVIVGTLLWAAYPKTNGREYLLDCRHGTTTLLLDRDSDDDDPMVLSRLVDKHHIAMNLDPKLVEFCCCEPRSPTRRN